MKLLTPTLFYKVAGWSGEAVKAMEHVRTSVKEIKTPTLVLQARDDHLISTRGLGKVRKWLSHNESEVVLLPHGSHALTRGKAKEEVFDRIFEFLHKVESLDS
jgi:carboxylesterase